MKHLAVIGTPISHSLSPAIHNAAARSLNAEFSLTAIDPQNEEGFRTFCAAPGNVLGFCVTVPYKQVAYELCDALSPCAANIKAVNTVTVRADGTLYGDNTDAPGFGRALAEGLATSDFSEFIFLVRGTGGAARALVYELLTRKAGGVLILSRDSNRARIFAESFSAMSALSGVKPPIACASATSAEFDVFINASILGLKADDALPLEEDILASGRVRYVFDAVYAKNRPTALVAAAHRHGVPAQDGKMMLVYQGVIASSLWNDEHSIWLSSGNEPSAPNFDEKEDLVTRAMIDAIQARPIVLIGFMGAGKTSVGRTLAAKTGRPFFDIDACVEEAEGDTVAEIFSLRGEDDFRDEETVALKKVLAHAESAIIASGGGIVVREENRDLLTEKAHVIYLCVPLDAALERVGSDETRPLLADSEDAVEYLFAQRSALYESIADETIDASVLSVEEIADSIAAGLGEV